ncbi:MAG TPA: cell envelope integrity protein TolA [Rhodanobacteraceae bacterium]|nr:cell envelope integrity protein TolA [Rhodanobacteraceae bacterium]
MEESSATPRAVMLSALLHLCIIGFLALAMLNCASWQGVTDFLHLPNPVACERPIQLVGPIIDATLVGPVGAPPPRHSKRAQPANPPPDQRELPKPEVPKPAPVKVLPPPPEHPDIKDQEKIADIAQQQADQQKAQEEKEKQRMAELSREQEADRILKELAKVKAQSAATQKQIKLAQQKAQQLADLKDTPDNQDANDSVPPAKQAMTGQNGKDNNAYIAALQNAITPNWFRPINMLPGTTCTVDIIQIPGGQVLSAKVVPQNCPMDDEGKHSVEAAVLRSSPLPYHGFEKEFQRDIPITFVVPTSQ